MSYQSESRNPEIVQKFADLVEGGLNHKQALENLDVESGVWFTRENIKVIIREWREAHPEAIDSMRSGPPPASVIDKEAREVLMTYLRCDTWEAVLRLMNTRKERQSYSNG